MNWHQDYIERYKKLKEQGKSFFPYAVLKDTIMAFFILGLLCWFAYHFGAALEDPADPTDSNYNPRPEWYFLFLFQALKLFPGNLESVAAVLLPGLGVTFLFLLPFLDRGPERHFLKRPFFTLLGVGTLAGIGYLTYQGTVSPLTNPIVEKDPLVFAGQRLYVSLNCSYCHKIGGKGGTVGPELDKVASGETEDWLEKHFREPQSVSPGSAMPKLNLLDDEIKVLVAFIKSLGGGEGFTEEAPKVFAENCAMCHKIGKEGAEVGPDLSLIGTARDKNYIRKYIEDPSKLNPTSNMPGYKGQLTDVQIEDLARYLSAQKGN
ncbi:MAG: c-type cytochrome [Elusimicrobia bacterium]|nr:c-type cytochrome [Elusimicrobiota bacterium]